MKISMFKLISPIYMTRMQKILKKTTPAKPNLKAEDVEDCIAKNRAKNTVVKTQNGLNTFHRFCHSTNENRKLEDIPITELDNLLCHFFLLKPEKS